MAKLCIVSVQLIWGVLAILRLAVLTEGQSSPRFSNIRFLEEPEDVIAIPGQRAILNCRVSVGGGPRPVIQWLRDGVALNLNTGSRRTLLSNGSLLFNPVVHTRSNKPDEGSYQCSVQVRNLGSVLSQAAKLQVAYLKPFFEEHPRDLSVRLGETAMFSCMIEGLPSPAIDWYISGSLVDTDSERVVLHPDGILEINDVSAADYGQYKCCATLEAVQDEQRCSANAALRRDVSSPTGAPVFVMRPVDTRVLVDSNVILYCSANGGDRSSRSPTITWLKDGVTLTTGIFEKHTITGQGSLLINGVKESDSALYTCRASNSEDSVDADAILTVNVPPRVVTPPDNVYANTKGEVQFDCEIYGVPKPAIHWRKNGNILVSDTYFQISDGQLRILGILSTDVGLYQCIGENAWGNVQASAQLKMLNENDPLPTLPSIHTTPNIQTGDEGSSSSGIPSQPRNLNMAITSTRFATIHWDSPVYSGTTNQLSYIVLWKEQGSRRERVQNTTTMQYTLQNLTPGTNYLVKVYSHNNVGRSLNAAELEIKTNNEAEVPSIVTNPSAVPLAATEIHVDWERPRESNGAITKYVIYYYEEGMQLESQVETTALSYVFSNLKSFKTYTFRIMAYNGNGAGPSTEEFQSTTFSATPSSPPSNVSLQVTSSTSILVQWEPPPADNCNGIITGYQIRYKRRSNRRARRVTTDANIRTFDLNDLDPDTVYSVRVAAQNVNGTGTNSIWFYATTQDSDLIENRVPGQPSSLATRALTNSIVVSWTPPSDPTVRIRGYTLNWGIGHPHSNRKQIESTKRFYTISDLQPSANYVISLKAFNDRGSGQARLENTHTRSVTATPEPATPMFPPVYLKALVVSDTSVTLTWIDNSLGAQQIVKDSRKYTVRYRQRNGRRYKLYNTTNLNAGLENLRPNTLYEFSVKVLNGRRQSTWSMTVENTTYESAPQSSPRDITPVALGPTTIQLNWQPPRHPNGQVTGYLIFYTTDNNMDFHSWVVEASLGNKMNKIIQQLTPDTTYYFRMQARNSKGYGPFSSTVIFRTPRADGTGGGTIHTPQGGNQPIYNNIDPNKGKPGSDIDIVDDDSIPNIDGVGQSGAGSVNVGGLSSNTLWIIIAVVAGVTVIAIIAFVGVMCRRRYSPAHIEKRQARNGGYKPNGKNKPNKNGPKDINPPDLWIHHEQMELKSMEKPNHPDQTMTVAPMRRNSQEELKPLREDENPMQMDKRRNSFLKNRPLFHRERTTADSAYSSHSSQDDDRYPRRHRSKPIMIPVDSQAPQPIATATAIPNGHILSDAQQNRPPYPRTQFNSTNLYSAPPRVHGGGECSLPSSEEPSDDSLERMGTIKRCPPQFAESNRPQSPDEKHCVSTVSTLGSDKGQRPVHPLKSFSVPGPPTASAPTTPTPKHIVKPQPPITSPYRQNSQSSASAVKSKPPLPVVMPRAPDVTIRGKEESEIQRANSTEELSAEMANLEGLMKDLNAITQNEFEC